MQGWGPSRFVRVAVGVPLALVAALALALAASAAAALKPIGEVGTPRPGETPAPGDLDRDGAGNTYVLDLLTFSVQKFDAANNPVLSYGDPGTGPGQFGLPHAIGVNEGTGETYVANVSEAGADIAIAIQRFDASGNYLGQFGGLGSAEGQFDAFIEDIAINTGTGDVFVAAGDRIQRFSATGQFELMWGKNVSPAGGNGPETCAAGCQAAESGDAAGELQGASGVTTFGSQVWVAEGNNNRVSRFSANTGAFQLMAGADVVPGGGTGPETCAAACKAGLPGNAAGQLDDPNAVDVNGATGRLYILDEDNDRVQRWSAGGLAFQTEWGSTGNADGSFDGPTALAESAGTVAVSDIVPSSVQTFDAGGAFQARFGQPGVGSLLVPRGVAVGPGGVYVSDILDRVIRYDGAGNAIDRFGGTGSSPGQLSGPTGIASAPDGVLYVADSDNNRIQRFDSGGGFLGEWGSSGTAPGQFGGAFDVAVGANGSVYVADSSNHRVQRFSAAGLFEAEWGVSGAAAGQFQFPRGIGTDPQGNVYVADTLNDRVQAFDANGAFLATWGGNGAESGLFDDPSDVAADGAGNVFVADTDNNRIQRFSRSGEFRERLGANGGDGSPGNALGEFYDPTAIAVDALGYVYVAETTNSRVQKLALEPELKLKGKKRQRAKKLKLKLTCVAGPCTVAIKGSGKAAKRKLKVKPRQLTLASGERRTIKPKLRKQGKAKRAIAAALRDGRAASLIVRTTATNEAGAAKANRKVKFKP